jgi:hypothetical protein
MDNILQIQILKIFINKMTQPTINTYFKPENNDTINQAPPVCEIVNSDTIVIPKTIVDTDMITDFSNEPKYKETEEETIKKITDENIAEAKNSAKKNKKKAKTVKCKTPRPKNTENAGTRKSKRIKNLI